MKTSTVLYTQRLSQMHDQSVGKCPVIKVITHLPAGEDNCFYIDQEEFIKDPSLTIKEGDEIVFDKQNGFQKCVLWNGHKLRQRGYSYDHYSPLR